MSKFALDDYSDRELVHVLRDLQGEDGWTNPEDVAVRVGIGKAHTRNVVIRLAWMRRFGIVEKEPKKHPARWRLTEAGEAMATATLRGALASELRKLKDHEIVFASHTLAGRFREAAAPHATMTRREWQREIKKRGAK